MSAMETVVFLQSLLGPGAEGAMLLVTHLGSEYAYVVFLALYFWLVDPHVGRRLGILMGLTFGLNAALKFLFAAPRPFHLDPGVASAAAKATAGGPGFPSGHTQGSATLWGFLALWHRRAWLAWIAGLVIVLVGVSRVYLGVHFPLDVVGGALLGLALAAAGVAFPSYPIWPLGARLGVVGGAFLLGLLWPLLAREFAVIAGFFFARPRFTPPATWPARLAFAGAGIALVLAVYVGLGVLLGEARHAGWGAFVRYFGLVVFATEVWPRVLPQRA